MTGKQTTVLWLGILLITVQFYFGGQWKALFGLVTNKPSPGTIGPTLNNATNAILSNLQSIIGINAKPKNKKATGTTQAPGTTTAGGRG